MKTLLLILSLSITTSVFANGTTDENGEACVDKASRIAKQYFEVADTKEQVGFVIFKDDTVTALNLKNTTPGSYDQTFISDVSIKFDRSSNAYRPKKDKKVRIEFSGDFDCDNLKVKEVSRRGGVERND